MFWLKISLCTMKGGLASNIEIERFCSSHSSLTSKSCFAQEKALIFHYWLLDCVLKWEIPFYCASLEKGKRVTRTEEGENIILSQTALISLIYWRRSDEKLGKWCKKTRTELKCDRIWIMDYRGKSGKRFRKVFLILKLRA